MGLGRRASWAVHGIGAWVVMGVLPLRLDLRIGVWFWVGYVVMSLSTDARPSSTPAPSSTPVAGIEEAGVEEVFYTGNRCRRRRAAGGGRAR